MPWFRMVVIYMRLVVPSGRHSIRTTPSDGSGACLPNSGAFYGYDAASRLQVVSNLAGQVAAYAYHSGADLVSNIVFTSGGQTRGIGVRPYLSK